MKMTAASLRSASRSSAAPVSGSRASSSARIIDASPPASRSLQRSITPSSTRAIRRAARCTDSGWNLGTQSGSPSM
jgi:hypothetical protein